MFSMNWLSILKIVDQADHRACLLPFFKGVYFGHRFRIGRIAAQAPYGICGVEDETAPFKDGKRFFAFGGDIVFIVAGGMIGYF